jgi:addiction module RelB/DinJ family antitoxin
MAQTALIQVRVDAELKKEAEALLNDMGLDTSTAVRIFFKQMIAQKGIPFAITSAGEPEKLAPGTRESGGEPYPVGSAVGSSEKTGGKRFPGMDHPVHLGKAWKWNREELYDRNK